MVSRGYQIEANARSVKHLSELLMAKAKVMTMKWRGYLSPTSHLWNKLYRFGQRQRKTLSVPTQRNTLGDQNPKGQLWLWAVLCFTALEPRNTSVDK